jgi:hypothetical protein
MGSFSDFLENELLDHVFLTGDYSSATNLYVALLTSTPDDADTGTSLPGELSGDAYVRIKCNTWDAAASGATENTQPVTFAQATGDWGTVTHFAVCDDTTNGNCLGWGALSASRVISSGDTARFATGDLDVTLD